MATVEERLRYWREKACALGAENVSIRQQLDEERKRCEDHTKVAIGKALRMGFELGFMSTSEGFNGEYPFDGDDFESVERLVKLREQKLEGKEV